MPNMLASGWGASNSDRTAALSAANPGSILPRGRLPRCSAIPAGSTFPSLSRFFFAILVWVILQKTTFGYELKASASAVMPPSMQASIPSVTSCFPWSFPEAVLALAALYLLPGRYRPVRAGKVHPRHGLQRHPGRPAGQLQPLSARFCSRCSSATFRSAVPPRSLHTLRDDRYRHCRYIYLAASPC